MHQIGAGVLGPVFRAYRPPHDRPFAVKAFHVDITPEQAETLTRRLDELVAAGSFHPGVVPATAVGVDDGVLYLAQEYVTGESLDAVMRDYAPAALETALPLIDRLAGALDACHARGVRHGGLHLRDIFITPSGGRVTGFGVVAALEEVGVSGPIRRPYTAPEVIARRPWGPAADRFALAAVAYELLTGKRAAGTGAQVTARLAHLDAVEDVESLQAVFETALADGPNGRYASAARFAADLHAAVGVPLDEDAEEAEEALEPAPPPLPVSGLAPDPGASAELPEGVEAAGAAAPAAEIRLDPLPGGAEPAVGDDGPDLAAEPAASLPGADGGAAAWEPEADPAPDPQREPEPAFQAEPAFEAEPVLEPEVPFEPEPDAGPGTETRRPAPSLFDAGALDPEIPSQPALPALGAAREDDALRMRPPAGLLDNRGLLDGADEPGAPGGDDVPYRPLASGSVLAIAAVLSFGAVTAYLVGLQLAGEPGAEDDRGAVPELAAPATAAAGGPGPETVDVAAPPPRTTGLTDAAAVERTPAPEPVRAPSPPPAPAPVPPSRAESAVPPPLAASAVPPPLAASAVPPPAPEAARPAPAARAGVAPAAPAPAAAGGWLLVRTDPPGATVTIDGVDRGRTPLALGDMPFDTYRVEVSREGFRSQAAALTLSAAATVASIEIALPPGADPPPAADPPPGADPPPAAVVGTVRVESRPPGATVVIDGREVGTTPAVVADVPAGTRSLRIELDGYQPWVTSVDVPPSDQVRVGASLDHLSER